MKKTQKTRAIIPIIILGVLLVATCVLRFFHLYKFTNSSDGYSFNTEMTIAVYVGLLLIGLASFLYSKCIKSRNKIYDNDNDFSSYFVSGIILSTAFFIDFIHQCVNIYNYVNDTQYIDKSHIAFLSLLAVFALLSTFYFVVLTISAKNKKYDFRNFEYLHFAPVLWGFIKLVMMVVKIIDIMTNVEVCLEFILVLLVILFLIGFLSSLDNEGEASSLLVFSSIMTFMLSVIISVPRIFLIIFGAWEKLLNVSYTGLTYLALGIFALTVLRKIIKNNFGD